MLCSTWNVPITFPQRRSSPAAPSPSGGSSQRTLPVAISNVKAHNRERMYKFRIKNWGLRKNWNDTLVKQAFQQLGDSVTTQENHVPLPDLEALHIRKLKRFLKRRQNTLEQLQKTDNAVLQTLFTPATAPKHEVPRRQIPLRPSKLRGPLQLELPNEMFHLLRSFLCSPSAEGVSLIPKPPEQDELSKLTICYSSLPTSPPLNTRVRRQYMPAN
jgi:hypothetical protein